MEENILNLETEMEKLQEYISDIDFCRRKVEKIDAETVMYKTNIKINVLVILTCFDENESDCDGSRRCACGCDGCVSFLGESQLEIQLLPDTEYRDHRRRDILFYVFGRG